MSQNVAAPPAHVVKRVSPMLNVADLEETLAFYTSVLGFSIASRDTDYAEVERNGATIMFLKAPEDVMQIVRGHAEIYIEVENIDALWQHVQGYKGQYRMRDLFDQPYGMTEFHIGDPNDYVVFVGQRKK